MIKRILLAGLVFIFTLSGPVTVCASVTSASAGRFLGELMTLITDEYAGGHVTRDELLDAAIRGMTSILDPYSEYMSADVYERFSRGLSGSLVGIGVHLRENDNGEHEIVRVLPETPARESGLQRGDIITMVNFNSTAGISIDDTVQLIGDPNIMQVNMQVLRGTEYVSLLIMKREIVTFSVYTDKLEYILGEQSMVYDDIGYLAISSISENTADALKNALNELKRENFNKVIIDMRGNVGGYLDVALEIGGMLIPSGPICYIVDAQGNRETIFSALERPPFARMVVLVDRYTASGAELLAAALQDSNAAVIVGETTFGKGVIQSIYTLSIGGRLKLTTEEYLRRSGGKINELGITPDYLVEVGIEDYETPKDAALLKALELLAG